MGILRAERIWRDPRLGWYDERLHHPARYPLATIWGAVPLFEALDAVAIAAPSFAHRAAVVAFADGAERYYDAGLRPTPGFVPYPGDRGLAETWFDDNGWWGIAFVDAFRATGRARYLHDAERAFTFIAAQGWDSAGGGGLWWNTAHTYRAGEALAADTLLGALLYRATRRPSYLAEVSKFLTWADTHFQTELGLYARTDSDPTPTPYVEGALLEAHELCQAGLQADCARARALADACWQRFQARLNMGPQYDTIYLHWMLVYGAQAGDERWPTLAAEMAANARTYALEPEQGLYLRAWDGTSITAHEAQPDMLQTDAATLELFAWLAAAQALA
jgi:Glycosyl hydrolase family 76